MDDHTLVDLVVLGSLISYAEEHKIWGFGHFFQVGDDLIGPICVRVGWETL